MQAPVCFYLRLPRLFRWALPIRRVRGVHAAALGHTANLRVMGAGHGCAVAQSVRTATAERRACGGRESVHNSLRIGRARDGPEHESGAHDHATADAHDQRERLSVGGRADGTRRALDRGAQKAETREQICSGVRQRKLSRSDGSAVRLTSGTGALAQCS